MQHLTERKRRRWSWPLTVLALLLTAAPLRAQTGLVRNGEFGGRGGTLKPEDVARFRSQGLVCPEAAEWPTSWGYYGGAGTFQFPLEGGVKADAFARITGKEAWLTGYHGLPIEGNLIYSVWARGKGKLTLHVISYGQDAAGNALQLVTPGEAVPPLTVTVDSPKWVRYQHLLKKTPPLWNVHPWLNAPEGTVDVDGVDIIPSTPALDLMVAAEEKLYGTGALIENLDIVQADEIFRKKQEAYQAALNEFQAAAGKLDKTLVGALEKETAALAPYVLTQGLTTVQVPHYNDMIVLTQALNNLAGKKPEMPLAIMATAAIATKIDYTPGVRQPKPDSVMVSRIEPNKILYEESEDATAQVRLKNSTATEQKVNVTAWLYTDLDSGREVARETISIAAGGESAWNLRFNVGPETFGRALEVRVTDAAGQELDRWQEYFQVAREWLRVQMHSGSRYNNMNHHFASEPTDWGIQPTDAEEWKAGQAGYGINPQARLNQTKSFHSKGRRVTFYQNAAFGGIMGYEEMRQHPEYALYDPNGQFGVDPVYGGYPNPMEIASPIETGPKRLPLKPYLNRAYTPWQHTLANFARDDVIEYGARCIRDYAKRYEFDGVFIDGTIMSVKGYGYDGKINLPADRKEVARLNARIQNLYCRILKAENPYFGTWYNFSSLSLDYMKSVYGSEAFLGSGVGDDDSDEWIRAMNNWKNVSCLMEWAATLYGGDSPDRRPKDCLEMLCKNRDYTVQKYGGNVIIGYLQGGPIEAMSTNQLPGPAKWGWPTANFFMSQIIATQHHIVVAITQSPSLEPSFQFQSRYSSLLWAPDIKLVPEVEKTVTVKTPEALWWKPLVYRRETKEGSDLIIHLVRIPLTPKWDLNWVDEPAPLAGVEVTANIRKGAVTAAYACRPYQFEEPQQAVRQTLQPTGSFGKTTVTIPPFRYYTMVVIRSRK